MVAGVGAADGGRVLARLARRLEVVHAAGAAGAGVEPGHGLEVQPELTHVSRSLASEGHVTALTEHDMLLTLLMVYEQVPALEGV